MNSIDNQFWHLCFNRKLFRHHIFAQSHYLNKSSFLFVKYLRQSSKSYFTLSTQATLLHNDFENCIFRITPTSPKCQRVNGNYLDHITVFHHSGNILLVPLISFSVHSINHQKIPYLWQLFLFQCFHVPKRNDKEPIYIHIEIPFG